MAFQLQTNQKVCYCDLHEGSQVVAIRTFQRHKKRCAEQGLRFDEIQPPGVNQSPSINMDVEDSNITEITVSEISQISNWYEPDGTIPNETENNTVKGLEDTIMDDSQDRIPESSNKKVRHLYTSSRHHRADLISESPEPLDASERMLHISPLGSTLAGPLSSESEPLTTPPSILPNTSEIFRGHANSGKLSTLRVLDEIGKC